MYGFNSNSISAKSSENSRDSNNFDDTSSDCSDDSQNEDFSNKIDQSIADDLLFSWLNNEYTDKNNEEAIDAESNAIETSDCNSSYINNIANVAQIVTENMLHENNQVTVDQKVLAIMDFYIQHKLTKSALSDLLKLLQIFQPQSTEIPKSVFQLLQFISKSAPTCSFIKHFYCKACLFYRNIESAMEICPACSITKEMSFYFELDVIDQIKFLFENRNLADKLHVRPPKNNCISDITDGSEYIRVNSRKNRGQYDLTLIMNTDGISLSKSSKSHCWPLMFMIAELPEYLRESFLTTIGIWYDTTHKPLMNTFLQPFYV